MSSRAFYKYICLTSSTVIYCPCVCQREGDGGEGEERQADRHGPAQREAGSEAGAHRVQPRPLTRLQG